MLSKSFHSTNVLSVSGFVLVYVMFVALLLSAAPLLLARMLDVMPVLVHPVVLGLL